MIFLSIRTHVDMTLTARLMGNLFYSAPRESLT